MPAVDGGERPAENSLPSPGKRRWGNDADRGRQRALKASGRAQCDVYPLNTFDIGRRFTCRITGGFWRFDEKICLQHPEIKIIQHAADSDRPEIQRKHRNLPALLG